MFALKNQIYVGSLQNPTYYFENDQISLCSSSQAVALVGQELSIDVFSPVVSDSEENLLDIYHFRSSNGQEIQTGVGQIYAIDLSDNGTGSDLINLADGTPVWYYHQGELVGKFYVSSVTRQARNKYKIDCTSAIGRLQKKYHSGGLFQAVRFETVLQKILAEDLHGAGDPVIDYVIDEDVANLPVTGWLPYSTKRDNLYRLIFAYGVNIIKNVSKDSHNGSPRFTFVYTAPENADEIETTRIKNGGSVEYVKPYSQVTVMEHSYTALLTAERVTLFDNTSGTAVSNEEIWFDNAPIIASTIVAEGSLTMTYASENSAVISGSGILTGIPYTHTTRSISQSRAGATEEKTISVEDCTLVNITNSENLLNRLYAFYCPDDFIKTIKNSLIYQNERCGKAYKFQNPFGEIETAFLASMDIVASSFDQANCVWYADYEPAGQEGILPIVDPILPPKPDEDPDPTEDEEGDWVVPPGVTNFKVVLIGGGQGGGSGCPGYNGDDAYTYIDVDQDKDLSAIFYGAEGGDGGDGGSRGLGGKIKIVDIENAVPGTECHWVLGAGGDGGAATSYRKDTTAELRAALENENPNAAYTDAQINEMISLYESDGWDGVIHQGEYGEATTFTIGGSTYSSANGEPSAGGWYDPVEGKTYGLPGNDGVKGGKGGARRVESNGSFNWVTDGETVLDARGQIYEGGKTGEQMISIETLPEAKFIAFGGNGAGAAAGLGRDGHERMDGLSDQNAVWYVMEDD